MHMAQVESYQTSSWVLEDGELLAFVSDMDDNWLLELKPPATPDCVASLSTTKLNKKPRRSRKLDIMNTRQEIIDLQDQLQMLQKQDELRDTTESSSRSNWRVFALHQQSLTNSARKENTRLLKQVQARAGLIQRIVRLINRQENGSIPRAVQLDYRVTSVDNPAHVYRVMQACLDSRSLNALDVIMSQCIEPQVDSSYQLRKFHWRTFALTHRCVGVEFNESVAMPLSSPFIHGVLYRYPVLINALEIREHNVRAVSPLLVELLF